MNAIASVAQWAVAIGDGTDEVSVKHVVLRLAVDEDTIPGVARDEVAKRWDNERGGNGAFVARRVVSLPGGGIYKLGATDSIVQGAIGNMNTR